MGTIKSVGVRDLKDNLSRYLETVRKGGELVVTEHGHPIARVIPIHGKASHERLAELMAAGDVSRARRATRTVPIAKRLPGGATVSDLVSERRLGIDRDKVVIGKSFDGPLPETVIRGFER